MVFKKPIFGPLEVTEILSLLTKENLPIYMVATLLNVDRMTLAKWREEQVGPPFVKLRRGVVVYPREAFQRYLKLTRQRESEATMGAPHRSCEEGRSHGRR